MSENEEGRAGRVAIIKKLIIALLVLGIFLPILLCILLFIKVEKLQKQVNELTVLKSEAVVTAYREERPKPQVSAAESLEPVWPEKLQKESAPELPEMTDDSEETIGTKVYLTFDDGPSSNTDEILDILKQYDIKATFFVTGKPQEVYAPLYRRIVEEGHTLGMHSYSHRYQEIYASKEAFSDDLEQLQEFLYDTTGVWSRFYRFPGGSSNNVSEVPMSELAEYLTSEDIYYLDWNVSCLDATGRTLRPQQIADNVTEHITKYHTAVVLLHDASDKTSTVEALPLIIEELKNMEHVEFAAVNDEMTMVQHLQKDRETN